MLNDECHLASLNDCERPYIGTMGYKKKKFKIKKIIEKYKNKDGKELSPIFYMDFLGIGDPLPPKDEK